MGRAQLRGAESERLAAEYLRARGLAIVARNVRCGHGEIDLVVRDGDTLVFVEVRARTGCAFGSAAESVDGRKQRRLLKSASLYLQRERLTDRLPCRFDVVAVSGAAGAEDILWVRDAFRAEP